MLGKNIRVTFADLRRSSYLGAKGSASWGVADAAAMSAMSLVIVIMGTRIGGVETAGQLSLMASVVLAALGFFRLGIGVPFLKESSANTGPPGREIVALSRSIAVLVVIVGGAIALATRSNFVLATSVWIAAALLLDSQRHIQMSLGRYQRLFFLDAVAAMATIAGAFFAQSAVQVALSASTALLAASILGYLFSRHLLSSGMRAALSCWWLQMRRAAGPLVVDGVVFTIAAQAFIWVLAWRADVSELGLYRIALLLAFPMSIMQTGVSNIVLQQLAASSNDLVQHRAAMRAGFLFVIAVGVALPSLLLLPFVNRLLLDKPPYVPIALAGLVLGNAVIVMTTEPLGRACIVMSRTLAMATARAAAGVLTLILCVLTPLGTNAVGAAGAVLLGQVIFSMSTWGIVRRRPPRV